MNKHLKRRLQAAAAASAVIVLLFVLGPFKKTGELVSVALLKAAAPAYAAGLKVRKVLDGAGSAGNGAEAAAETIERLRLENAGLKEMAEENAALKEALGFRERNGGRSVPARVVAVSDDDGFHALTVDRGRDDGIEDGLPVIAGDGVIIGKVCETRSRSSSVLLLSDSKSRLAVTVGNDQRTTGVLEGDRGLGMTISLIPQNEKVSPGDAVITSGLEPGIRRGLAVGVIEKVEKSAQKPFQSAAVSPFRTARYPLIVQILLRDE